MGKHKIAVDELAPKNGPKIYLKSRITHDATDILPGNYDDPDDVPKAVVAAMIQVAVPQNTTVPQNIPSGGDITTQMSYTGDLTYVFIYAEYNGQPYPIGYDKIAKTITRSSTEDAITVFYKP